MRSKNPPTTRQRGDNPTVCSCIGGCPSPEETSPKGVASRVNTILLNNIMEGNLGDTLPPLTTIPFRPIWACGNIAGKWPLHEPNFSSGTCKKKKSER